MWDEQLEVRGTGVRGKAAASSRAEQPGPCLWSKIMEFYNIDCRLHSKVSNTFVREESFV